MLTFKRRFFKILLIFLAFIPVTAFAHFIFFPQETRSILIDFSSFSRDGRLYFNRDTKRSRIDSLESLIRSAFNRTSEFWGGRKADPKFIYGEKEGDFKNYSVSPDAPAVTYCKWGTYIVLSEQGVNLDIIAHELSHAELFARIGFYQWTYGIPDWFKHGLAMQNDYRNYYSTDTLKVRTDNLKKMPDIKQFKTSAQFYNGTIDQVMLRYMVAKYEVGCWYSRDKLNQLIKDLNSGKSFDESFPVSLSVDK
jgi:hypothetical protein